MTQTDSATRRPLRGRPPRTLLAVLALLVSACGNETPNGYQPTVSDHASGSQARVYLFSIHPLHNPARLHESFAPVMDYLSRHVDNAEFVLEASRDYATYDQRLYAGHPDFSLPNPYQTVNAMRQGYRVFAKMAGDQDFRGIILVRRDSGIRTVTDLKGKAVAYPAPTALAATMLPQYYLQTHGLNVMHDVETRYVGSQESSIMNVYLGNVAAAATWPPPWRALLKERPELADRLVVKWQTDSLPNNGLVVHQRVDPAVAQRVAELLLHLHESDEGRVMLKRIGLSRFEPASAATYQPVATFLQEFEHRVRPLN